MQEKEDVYRPIVVVDANLPVQAVLDFARQKADAASHELVFVIDTAIEAETMAAVLTENGFETIEHDRFVKQIKLLGEDRMLVFVTGNPEYAGQATISQVDCKTGRIFHQTQYDLSPAPVSAEVSPTA